MTPSDVEKPEQGSQLEPQQPQTSWFRALPGTRVAAGALVALSLAYCGAALGSGHSASSSPAPEVDSASLGLGVWDASSLLLDAGRNALLIDTREERAFALYHLPGSTHKPGIGAKELRERAEGKALVLVVSDSDAKAGELVGEAQGREKPGRWHFLSGGVREWYLTYTLPVPVFSEKPAPYGYAESLAKLKGALQGKMAPSDGKQALAKLQAIGYSPSLLQGTSQPKATGKRKKISGGCGG